MKPMNGGGGQILGRDGGFSLVELMVAILISTFLVAALYMMFVTNNNLFFVQERVADSQAALRFSMDMIRQDLSQAGYLASPDANRDPRYCAPALQANPGIGALGISVIENDGDVYLPDANNVKPDTILLMGNYVSSDTYFTKAIARSGNQAVISLVDPERDYGGMETFTRFTKGLSRVSKEDFASGDIFRTGEMLRLMDSSGRIQIATVVDVDDQWKVTASGLFFASQGDMCGIKGTGEGLEVNPVNIVQYRISGDPNQCNSTVPNTTCLLRSVVDVQGNLIGNNQVVVADNAVDLQIWFMVDETKSCSSVAECSSPNARCVGPPASSDRFCYGDPPSIKEDNDFADELGNKSLSAIVSEGRIADIRSAIIRLSIRSSMEDIDFPMRAREGEKPLVAYEVNDKQKGAARVRTTTTEIQIRNFGLGAI